MHVTETDNGIDIAIGCAIVRAVAKLVAEFARWAAPKFKFARIQGGEIAH